jgi:hypothetical protein
LVVVKVEIKPDRLSRARTRTEAVCMAPRTEGKVNS